MKYKFRFILAISVFFTLITWSVNIFAQTGEGGFPPSFYYAQSLRSQKLTEVPVNFYVEDLRETDRWKTREGIPMPVSKLIEVNYTPDNSGEWITLPKGEQIWQLKLKAEGAIAIMLYYSDFYIPAGGKLFIYSSDKSQLLGAYTEKTNPGGGLFATEFIGGQELVLEYVASTVSDEKPRITISETGYGYNASALKAFCGIELRATSGTCEVNINCEEGRAWQNEKRGVCYMVQRIGLASYICTGALMNNTAEDFAPLIITAKHCADDGTNTASENDMKQWQFSFHYERPDCSNNSPAVSRKTLTGCTLAALTETNRESDGMLLLLNNMIPEDYDVYYNGWDRRDIVSNSGVGIHHPNGDFMKISTYSQPATVYTFESSEFTGGRNAHLNVTFKATANGHGVTEGGSSGSPLFNESKLVVGTLTGGNSSCIYTRGMNLYGRLYNHWDKYDSDSISQMNVWLDPLNTRAETLAGRYRGELIPAPTNLQAVNQGQAIYLSWDAPYEKVNVEKYNVYRNNQIIAETSELFYSDGDAQDGQNTYSVSAVYPDKESSFVTVSISFIKYKAPTDLQAVRISDSKVKVSWKAPVYEQTIYWGSLTPAYGIGFRGNVSFYYGHKWRSSELSPLHMNLVKAVQFFPVAGNSYQVYVAQGNRQYRQEIDNSTLRYNKINTVNLDNPFVIDASKDLIISIYISSVGTDYPAVCDNGPAFNGKGNIFSEDGDTWYNLYSESRPDDFDYNFIVTAVISSETREIASQPLLDGTKKSSMQKSAMEPRSIQKEQIAPSVDLRSSAPISFPTVTRYKLYRQGSSYNFTQETLYMENTSNDHYTYEVSAYYGDIESPKSGRVGITVSNDKIDVSTDIFPSAFDRNVFLKGSEYVMRVDVFSVSGKLCLFLHRPGQLIDTSSLTPGIYFFRIYGNNGKILKTVRAVKM